MLGELDAQAVFAKTEHLDAVADKMPGQFEPQLSGTALPYVAHEQQTGVGSPSMVRQTPPSPSSRMAMLMRRISTFMMQA